MPILSRKNAAWTSRAETSAHFQKQRGISWNVDHHTLGFRLLSAAESKLSFRCGFRVTQARSAAGSPANVSYKSSVRLPLNTGDLNCETWTRTRGGLAGLVRGGLRPVFSACPVA